MSVVKARRDEGLRAVVVDVRPLVDPASGEKVGAASGVVLFGGRLFVVQDDALSGVWVDPGTLAMERVVLLGGGERLAKAQKADFEAVFEADGAFHAVGSGGTERRTRVVRYEPGSGERRMIEAKGLYEAMSALLPVTVNIEGAVCLGETVRLFHRANGKGSGHGASFDVGLAALLEGSGRPENQVFYDLDRVNGVALTFTDAARLGEKVLYLAAAEDSADAIADGPIAGAAIGVIAGGEARYALLTERDGAPSVRKIEGIALVPGGREAFVVTDPDDEARPSELCRVVLEGY